MADGVVIQTFDPNLGGYFECLNCRTHIALHTHILQLAHYTTIDQRAFSEAINVYTNSPDEDDINYQHNWTTTNVYCISCDHILGYEFIQVAEDAERPMLGEFVFNRVVAVDFQSFGDYYECWQCSRAIAVHSDILPIAQGTLVGFRSFSQAANVYTTPDEDIIDEQLNRTSTTVYCTCELYLGIQFIQVAEDAERPLLGELILSRRRLVRITYLEPHQIQVAEGDDMD